MTPCSWSSSHVTTTLRCLIQVLCTRIILRYASFGSGEIFAAFSASRRFPPHYQIPSDCIVLYLLMTLNVLRVPLGFINFENVSATIWRFPGKWVIWKAYSWTDLSSREVPYWTAQHFNTTGCMICFNFKWNARCKDTLISSMSDRLRSILFSTVVERRSVFVKDLLIKRSVVPR